MKGILLADGWGARVVPGRSRGLRLGRRRGRGRLSAGGGHPRGGHDGGGPLRNGPDAAYRANALGSANVARACHRHGARPLAMSTDYVFSGELDRPYHEWDEPDPRTVYGRSKAAGEEAVRTLCPDHVIVRTAWLYGPGGPSFLHTMLKMGREPGPPLKVVDDQRGGPTSTRWLAACLERLLFEPVGGTVHASCEGETTWFGFAREIFALWGLRRELVPCRTGEFPRTTSRPANSRLKKRILRLLGWPPPATWRDEPASFRNEYPEG